MIRALKHSEPSDLSSATNHWAFVQLSSFRFYILASSSAMTLIHQLHLGVSQHYDVLVLTGVPHFLVQLLT